MIERFDGASRQMVPLEPGGAAPWLHVTSPTTGDLDALGALGLPADLLGHSLDDDELARVDHAPGGVTLVVLRVPLRTGDSDKLRFRAATLGVFLLAGERVVTISRHATTLPGAAAALEHGGSGWPQRALLRLVHGAAAAFLKELVAIDRHVAKLEDELQASLRNREVLGLLELQKCLVHFTTALASNQIMLERLQRDPRVPIGPEEHELLEDALVELKQAIEMTRISEEILSQMMDAFASIISNNLNVVMKVLTSATLLLTVPMLVSSIYGMNVQLPMQHHPAAFVITMSLAVVVAIAVASVLWRKKWL